MVVIKLYRAFIGVLALLVVWVVDREVRSYEKFSHRKERRIFNEAIESLQTYFFDHTKVEDKSLYDLSLKLLCDHMEGCGSTDHVLSVLSQDKAKALVENKRADLLDQLWLHSRWAQKSDSQSFIHLRRLLQALDPYTQLYSPDLWHQLHEESRGAMVGIGLTVRKENRFLRVVALEKDSPADRSGIHLRDLITRVNRKQVAHLSMEEIAGLMRGPSGSHIDLQVLDIQNGKTKNYQIQRESLLFESVKIFFWDQKEGPSSSPLFFKRHLVLSLSFFSSQTSTELRVKLNQIRSDYDGVIVDLRDNPGGSLAEAIKVADYFLDEGSLVFLKERVSGRTSFFAQPHNYFKNIPVVVLVSENTASSAEMLAAILQFRKRAVVVGSKTVGKSSIQRLQPLPFGFGLKMTVGHFKLPDRSFFSGVRPDYKILPLPLKSERIYKAQLKSRPCYRSVIREESLQRSRRTQRNPWFSQNVGIGEAQKMVIDIAAYLKAQVVGVC